MLFSKYQRVRTNSTIPSVAVYYFRLLIRFVTVWLLEHVKDKAADVSLYIPHTVSTSQR